MNTGSGKEKEQPQIELCIWTGRMLIAGVVVGLFIMGLGILPATLPVFYSGSQTSLLGISSKLLNYGLIIILLSPVFGFVSLLVEFSWNKEWRFVLITVCIIGILMTEWINGVF